MRLAGLTRRILHGIVVSRGHGCAYLPLINLMSEQLSIKSEVIDPHTFNYLILYLENCNGPDWNKLISDLAHIYRTVDRDGFMTIATASCVDFVSANFWGAFQDRDSFKTLYLVNNRQRLIAGAAAAIAYSALQEFNLGNF